MSVLGGLAPAGGHPYQETTYGQKTGGGWFRDRISDIDNLKELVGGYGGTKVRLFRCNSSKNIWGHVVPVKGADGDDVAANCAVTDILR